MTCFALEGIVIELSWLGLCWLSPLSEQNELYFFALHFFRLPEQCFFPYLSLPMEHCLCHVKGLLGTGCFCLKCSKKQKIHLFPWPRKVVI